MQTGWKNQGPDLGGFTIASVVAEAERYQKILSSQDPLVGGAAPRLHQKLEGCGELEVTANFCLSYPGELLEIPF